MKKVLLLRGCVVGSGVYHPCACPICGMDTDVDERKDPQVVHCSRCGADWVHRSRRTA